MVLKLNKDRLTKNVSVVVGGAADGHGMSRHASATLPVSPLFKTFVI